MKALLALLFASCFLLSVNAQISDPQWGLVPYQTYSGSDLDQINVKTDILNFTIPLWSYPQRGGRLTSNTKLQYNSQYYSVIQNCDPADPTDCSYILGHATVSTVNYSHYTHATFRSLQSAGFRFVDNDTASQIRTGAYGLSTSGVGLNGTPTRLAPFNEYELVSSDGAAHPWNVIAGTGTGDGLTLGYAMSLDGTGYHSSQFGILDRNGNTGLQDADGNALGVSTEAGSTDTMGRPFYSFSDSSDSSGCTGPLAISSVSIASVPGANGSTLTYKFCYASVPVYISGQTCQADNDINESRSLLQSVVLPNGQAWTFEYNAYGPNDPANTNYGEITKVTLPAGGTLSYTYDTTNCLAVITSRTINDGSASHTWTYQISNGAPNGAGEASFTDPDQNKTVIDYNDRGYESTTQVFSVGATTPIRRTDTTYLPAVDAITPSEATGDYVNELPQTVTTTLDNGLVSKKVYTYCCDYTFSGFALSFDSAGNGHGGIGNHTASYGIKSGEADYDYGQGSPGPLLRSTQTTFLWQSNQSYLDSNLLNTPSVITVTDGTNTVSKTLYAYDDSASIGVPSGITTAQQLNSAANPGILGHATTVSRVLLDSGSTVDTHATFYDTGEVASTTDANGNTTNYQYSSDYWGGLPTKITNPLQQFSTFTYDLNTGQKASVTDPNSQTTSWSFDNEGRLIQIQGPVNPTLNARPTTSICYDDIVGTCLPDSPLNAILVTQSISPSVSSVIEHRSDGLNRDTGTRLLSDPYGTVYTLKTYDNLGRVFRTWNPSRCALTPTTSSCTGETSFGYTTLAYDALGRVLTTTQPDNTAKIASYNGNATTTKDEAGNAWTQTSDALGRLTQVQEPGGAATTYVYNTRGDLTNVTQPGLSGETARYRSFTYDSLSRLTTSSNPETGTICYGLVDQGTGNCQGRYDGNGNLRYKTDANGVTTSFSYDALNRLTFKVFGDGAPSEAFGYDGNDEGGQPIQSLPGTYGIGRLTHVSNQVNSASDLQYNAMGQLIAKKDCNVHDCSYTDTQSFDYDLAGNMTSVVYADGRGIQQKYDGAGHLSSVKDTGTGAIYFTAQQYSPAGPLSQAVFGNGVTEFNVYNNRLQPCHSYSSTTLLPGNPTGGNLLDRQSFYNASASSPCGSEGSNNGNVYAITDNLNTGWTQSFNYDGLNRLITAGRSDSGYNHTYNYDSFGNMVPQDNLHNNPDLRVDSTNRLYRYASNAPIYSYDNAGNLISSGTSDIGGHSFSYNAMGQVTTVDGGANASYVYTALEERASKTTTSGWTDYVYLNSQPMSEHNSDGSWTDYIYANGRKIAKTSLQGSVIHLSGSNVPNSGSVASGVDVGGLNGTTLQSGDTLQLWQYTTAENGAAGGVWLGFTNGDYSTSWSHGRLYDSDGQEANQDGVTGNWHHRTIDLSAWAGLTVSRFLALDERNGATGQFDVYFADVALRRADGTIIPVWAGSPAVSSLGATVFGPGSATAQVDGNLPSNVDSSVQTVHYYLDDHLGTAQMELSGGGWPTWMGQFTPFGQELDNGLTAMHYKFTGKERDAESGLDYFGARYYASPIGRWLAPDWASHPEAIPYGELHDPQTLNLYAYVSNNPLRMYDADGHHQECGTQTSSTDPRTGVLTVHANCHNVPDWWQFQGARRWLGRHPKTVKTISAAVMIPTALSGVLDGGASELALPEELALEEVLLEGGAEAAESEAASTAETGIAEESGAAETEAGPKTSKDQSLRGREDQLKDMEREQKDFRSGKRKSGRIDSIGKSKQNLRNALKNIRSSKDIED